MERVRYFDSGDGRRRPNPLVAVYRWRYEVALLAIVVALVRLGQLTHGWVAVSVAFVAVVIAVAVPAVRAFVLRRGRCVVTQHRLRSAFHEAGLGTLGGRLPAILWCTPKAKGIRVLVSLRAGLGVEDFVRERKILAAACFASDVYVERHPRYANLVVLFVATAPTW